MHPDKRGKFLAALDKVRAQYAEPESGGIARKTPLRKVYRYNRPP